MAYWQDAHASEPAAEQGSGALTVSAAMALAKGSLESVTVRIIGEVSEVSVKPGYKAAYFTVKDPSASLPCMMWNNRYRASDVKLAVGQLVEIAGRFTLYAAKGRMNFDVFSLSLAGEGDLRLKVANIAKRLQAEGLTDPARKRPLPAFPERIGLVTSPRSAAVHDVLRTLRRRFPVAHVLLAGVPVEGANAAAGIIEGLRCVVSAGCEVVLVVRGGGSFEDMMPFNDETLARAIAASPVPVVTGIGHEVDTSIADMVSDLRASTPTAAAEAVSPSAESIDALFSSRASGMRAACGRRLGALGADLARLSQRPAFQDPLTLFSAEAQALDIATERLARALPATVEAQRLRVDAAAERLLAQGPRIFDRHESNLEAARAALALSGPHSLERHAAALGTAKAKLSAQGPHLLDSHRAMLATSAARLEDLSPLGTIARGYSITRNAEGDIVRNVSQVSTGSHIEITVSDGTLNCEVLDTKLKADEPAAESPVGA